MKFTPNKGINPDGDIIPSEKRGTILPSTKEADELRRTLAQNSPRMMGKKLKVKETAE
jgi:hypothetical protein